MHIYPAKAVHGKRKLAVFVIGTRAQLIKVAPVISECEKRDFLCILLMSGQHKDTMEDLINEFSIESERVYATVPIERSTLVSILLWLPKAYKGILNRLKEIQNSNKDCNMLVIVHGDTLTTLISAYCSKKMGCRVVHLESGLTSGNYFSPFPEEIIRNLVFKMTDIAFCPDKRSYEHMKSISMATIFNSNGNTILDSINEITRTSNLGMERIYPYIVVSIHRFNNIYTKDRLIEIIEKLKVIREFMEVKFVLHPATIKRLKSYHLFDELNSTKGIQLIPRMTYSNFIRQALGAQCILTDGGSNQEELAYLGIPTIIMRPHTERLDGLGDNAIMEKDIMDLSDFFLQRKYTTLRREKREFKISPSQKIVDALEGLD